MSTEQNALLEVGIDYITATGFKTTSPSSLYSFGQWLVSEEVSSGFEDCNWRTSGYRGRRAGRVCVGLGNQGSIVRASSTSAATYWAQIMHLARRITRLDVQMTGTACAGCANTLVKHHKEAKRAPCRRGRPSTFKVWYGPQGAESMSLGSRTSEVYGRIYDKGRQSGLEQYRGALRYECEYHREVAGQMARYIDSQESDQAAMLSEVYKFFTVRGISIPDYRSVGILGLFENVQLQSQELIQTAQPVIQEHRRSLSWIAVSVRPTVERLIRGGLEQEVLDALGLTEIRQ